jgi:hypothetical protein
MNKTADLLTGTGGVVLTMVNDSITPDILTGTTENPSIMTAVINLIIAGVTLFKLLKKPKR